jgi:hypothetical protein
VGCILSPLCGCARKRAMRRRVNVTSWRLPDWDLGTARVPLCAVCILSQGYMSQVPQMIFEEVVENEGVASLSHWLGSSRDLSSAPLQLLADFGSWGTCRGVHPGCSPPSVPVFVCGWLLWPQKHKIFSFTP